MKSSDNPFDPNRFMTKPESTQRKVRFGSTQAHAEVHGRSKGPSAENTNTIRRGDGIGLYILLSLLTLLLGVFSGPVLFGDNEVLSRASTNLKSIWTHLPSYASTLGVNGVHPPPIPPHISAFVQDAIRVALKDPVGRRDFALAADGARIAPKLTSSFEDEPLGRSPENILDDDMRMASCWIFSGSHAQVGIRLNDFIFPTHITIDHVPREIAARIEEAPRSMVLWGLIDGKVNEHRLEIAREMLGAFPLNQTSEAPPITAQGVFVPLIVFEYDIHSDSHIQTFSLDSTIAASRLYFGAVVLEIRSNWGGENTRVYRVRLHGTELAA